jgi:hypothetical protein
LANAFGVKQRNGSAFTAWALMPAALLMFSHTNAAAIDEIQVEVSRESCAGFAANDKSFVVYATNTSLNHSIDANFKYDSNPAQQHFILFDAKIDPITDRFPKYHVRRLAPGEAAPIGCTATYRASPQPLRTLSVPIVITKQNASYVEANTPEIPPEDAAAFAAYYLQDGIAECGPGAKPPGLFYLVNLHPYARLSVSMNLLDDRGNRVGVLAPKLAPLSAARAGCSNGSSKPGPITDATLEVIAAAAIAPPRVPSSPSLPLSPSSPVSPSSPSSPSSPPQAAAPPPLVPLPLETILQTQNICAGSVPPGWIKINDAWNPTVCGNPARIAYNVWTIQRFDDQPVGAVIHACKGSVPSAWVIVGTLWNPTVCGHPAANQPNVMAIKRLN